MPRRFKVGDIVKVTKEGLAEGAGGYLWTRCEVVSICEGDRMLDECMICVVDADSPNRYPSGRWRERWYEFYEPPEGPW